MLWCLNCAISELGNTIPCTVRQTTQPEGCPCIVWLHSQYRVATGRCGAYTNHTACRDSVAYVTCPSANGSTICLHWERRVYSIMEGEPKGKQCLHTIYFPSSLEVRPRGLLELNSIIFPSCSASSCTRSEYDRAFWVCFLPSLKCVKTNDSFLLSVSSLRLQPFNWFHISEELEVMRETKDEEDEGESDKMYPLLCRFCLMVWVWKS
jgi:hypothetical protein